MLSLTVMGGTSMGGLLANASNTNGYLTTLLSLVPNLPTRNITTIKNTTVPASGDMVWISNATSLGEPVVGRTPAVVNDMVVGPDGYIPFPARVVSTIYTCNGPVYVLSGSMVFAENTVMPSDEDVDAASAYLQVGVLRGGGGLFIQGEVISGGCLCGCSVYHSQQQHTPLYTHRACSSPSPVFSTPKKAKVSPSHPSHHPSYPSPLPPHQRLTVAAVGYRWLQ